MRSRNRAALTPSATLSHPRYPDIYDFTGTDHTLRLSAAGDDRFFQRGDNQRRGDGGAPKSRPESIRRHVSEPLWQCVFVVHLLISQNKLAGQYFFKARNAIQMIFSVTRHEYQRHHGNSVDPRFKTQTWTSTRA